VSVAVTASSEARRLPVRLTLLGWSANETNGTLIGALRARGLDVTLVPASEALGSLRSGDRALARLDVSPGLDGVEPGLLAILRLERRGVHVLNRAPALLAAHDKLRTARVLEAAGLPHPRTFHLPPGRTACPVEPPVVLKPRFGSWGRDVFRCDDAADVARALAAVRDRPWFRRHGVLVQELLPVRGSDLRLVVARGRVIGSANRVARPGEWRTNTSLGGTLEHADPPPDARSLALSSAAALGMDVVGIDLFPVDGGYTVLELNGAVDFDERYSIEGRDVYDELIEALLG
jgi:RimK family alpha-L-glutamate ligase